MGCAHTVTGAELEHLSDGEIVAAILCRLEELKRAGCHAPRCLELASRTDVDLELAADLVARGCPPELAVRILL